MSSVSPYQRNRVRSTCTFLIVLTGCMLLPLSTRAEAADSKKAGPLFSLRGAIESAIKVNLGLNAAQEGTEAAYYNRMGQRTRFFPTFNMTYQYRRMDEALQDPRIGLISPLNEYRFSTRVSQPIFTGFALLNRYKIAGLGSDAARASEALTRQDVILEAKRAYFLLLRAEKLQMIAQETVTQIEAQREVAANFYRVGMTPLNDLLEAEVELANAKFNLTVAQNNLEIARSAFNTLLRRPVGEPVTLQDILSYVPLEYDLAYCFETAEANRLEPKIARLEVDIARKEVELAKADYYPAVSLEGTYSQVGTDWDARGGAGITSDPSSWNIAAVASWNFWEWGRVRYGVGESRSRLAQAEYRKEEIRDRLILEVKEAFLRSREAEKNIGTIEQAIEQAKENFRINQERYKEQVATSTEVLDAQTLLSRTMTNYYTALYDFSLSKAALHRAMGLEVME